MKTIAFLKKIQYIFEEVQKMTRKLRKKQKANKSVYTVQITVTFAFVLFFIIDFMEKILISI